MKLYPSTPALLKHFLPVTLGLVGAALIITSCLYLYLSPKLPSVETLKDVKLQTPLRIYSQDSQLIGEFGEQKRSPIEFEQIPDLFIKAILAAEDDNFFHHSGVDVKGLLRAATQLATSGNIQSGGSTITMQVARNIFLTRQQTFTRKFNEILLALRIEQELSKNEILTLYTNKIYLGNRAYGLAAAAQVYYGKPVNQLTLPQLAMIAGLPKAPSAYNPLANPSRAVIRRNWILQRMESLGYLDHETSEEAQKTPVTASYHGSSIELEAPYIAEMVRQKALSLYGDRAYNEGLKIFTTVNSRLQTAAHQAVIKGVEEYDARHGYYGPEKQVPDATDWPEVLSGTPEIAGKVPAIVTEVNEQSLNILFKTGETDTLKWENGLEGLRLFIDENHRSGKLQSASEVFKQGDLIRVSRKDDQWQLTQVPKSQAALISLDPINGAIKALVGGYSFEQSHYNRVTQAKRQPGSNFKPFIYATAMENGFTAASIFNDAPVVFRDKLLEDIWRPENDSGKFYGPTRLRKALYLSRNLVSIRLLNNLGVNKAIKGLERFGFPGDELPRNLSLALGSYATTPLKIVTAYSVLANGGYKVEPYLIDRIEDIDGDTIYENHPFTVCRECEIKDSMDLPEPDQSPLDGLEDLSAELGIKPASLPPENIAPRILDERIAYIMDSILKDVIKRGTGTRAKSLGRSDIAGKTGTTNGPRDAWFSGYNPTLVTTTWLGFDQNNLLGRNEYGGSAALPIWIAFMEKALANTPETSLPQPEGITTARIDPETGLRVPPGSGNAIFEYFLAENLPPLEDKAAIPSGPSKKTAKPEDIF